MCSSLRSVAAVLVLLGNISVVSSWADAPIEETLKEVFILDSSRVRCESFSNRAIMEIAWPTVQDEGRAAELARLLAKYLNSEELFFATDATRSACREMDRWVRNQANQKIRLTLTTHRSQGVRHVVRPSRDEDEQEYYVFEETGYYQISAGTLGDELTSPIQAGLVANENGFVWTKLIYRTLAPISRTPIANPFSEVTPNLVKQLSETITSLEDSKKLDPQVWKVGVQVLVPTAGDVGALAVIEEIFPSGRARFRFVEVSGELVGLPLATAGIPVAEWKGFRIGSKVQFFDKGTGISHLAHVTKVFSNGYLEVRYMNGGLPLVVRASRFTQIGG